MCDFEPLEANLQWQVNVVLTHFGLCAARINFNYMPYKTEKGKSMTQTHDVSRA